MTAALWHAADYGTVAERVCWSLFAITTAIVALRICSRTYFGEGKYGGIGLDDHITMFCVVLMLVTCIFITIGSNYGLGQRMAKLSPEQTSEALRWNVIINSVVLWTFSMPKFAIIALLKRILDYGTKTTILFWCLALSSQACILATSVWWWKQCSPVEFNWNKTIKGSCASTSVMADLGFATSAYSAFLDVFFALYPIPFIMHLNLPFKNRVAISIALGLSSLACVVSIYKLTIVDKVFEVMSKDPTYPVPYLDMLGVVEGSILLICASLPTLGPLVRKTKGRVIALRSITGQSSQPTSAHNNGNIDKWGSFSGKASEGYDSECALVGPQISADDVPLVRVDLKGGGNQIHQTAEFDVT